MPFEEKRCIGCDLVHLGANVNDLRFQVVVGVGGIGSL